MKDYVDALARDLVRYIDVIDRKNERHADTVDQKNQEALRAALASEQLARTVALVEIKAGQQFHNDLIRKGERDRAETTAQMVTKVEFRPVADFVEGSRQSAITTGKFVGFLLTAIALAMTFGFGLASYLQSARNAERAATPSHLVDSAPSAPQVVIPLPPARMTPPETR